ncbi:hypothetical protein CYG49_01755 [Candidatus Saccharibacteria bacterium]|nr:MAG: hypothetical protein CYG49_01755 [Candidatus Saccharibacteria bacterium]
MNFNFEQFKNLGDLKEVWNRLQERNWSGLIEAIQEVRDEKGNTEPLTKTEAAAHQAEAEGYDFPQNPIELAKLLSTKF